MAPGGEVRPQRIWLVGPMGAGKSTTGAAVATALGWRYLDNDVELARVRGQSARTLAARGGAAVHAAEQAVAESFFLEPPPLVATFAASVVELPATVAHLRASGRAVYLQVPPTVLSQRVQGTDRPWIGVDQGVSASLLALREGAFVACADVILDGTAVPSALVSEIVRLAGAWWPGGPTNLGSARAQGRP